MINARTGVAFADGFYVTWYEGKRYVHTTLFDTEYESAHGEIHVCQECYAKAIVTVLRQIHESSGKSCPGE